MLPRAALFVNWSSQLEALIVREKLSSLDPCHYLLPLIQKLTNYSRTSLFRTRLIRSPRYFEGRSNALGFTFPLYASPVISKPRYFERFFISLGTSK